MDWNVLHLKPRTEKKVAEICARHNLPHYLPLRRSLRIYPRRRVVFEVPLFPGYLFAAYDASQRATLFRGNYIVRVLKPESQMRLLRQLVQVRRLLRADPELDTIDPITCGDPVRIKTGPFAGFKGIVVRIKNKPDRRLVVLNIELVGRAVAAETDARFVERDT
jgi:transcription antitermination factor NusG